MPREPASALGRSCRSGRSSRRGPRAGRQAAARVAGAIRREDAGAHRPRRRGRAGSCSPSRRPRARGRAATSGAAGDRLDEAAERTSGRWLIAATAASWSVAPSPAVAPRTPSRAPRPDRCGGRVAARAGHDDPRPVAEQVRGRPPRSRSSRGRPSDGPPTNGSPARRLGLDDRAFVLATSVMTASGVEAGGAAVRRARRAGRGRPAAARRARSDRRPRIASAAVGAAIDPVDARGGRGPSPVGVQAGCASRPASAATHGARDRAADQAETEEARAASRGVCQPSLVPRAQSLYPRAAARPLADRPTGRRA